MSRPRPGTRLVRLAASAALLLMVPFASAQETSGKTDLLEAVEAARGLTALKADVELSGAGGFADWVPSGKGTLLLVKDAEAAEANPDASAWHTRVDSSYIHKKGEPEKQVVVLRTPDTLAWVDHEAKAVEERNVDDRRSEFRSIPELFGLPELTSAEPYSRELREAESWESLGTQTVNGVECDVVMVRFDMTKGENPRGGSMIRTPATKWFFGKDDHLPRRVERITDQGGISFTIVQDITNLQTSPGITPTDLAIATPTGYTRSVRNRPEARPQTMQPGANNSAEVERARAEAEKKALAEADLPAHGFELVDGEGNTVTLDGLKGQVAVLYFWGTWCVPCKEYTPLVSNLVSTFEGQPVKVFGLPVRERSEEAVREAMQGFDHTLLLNPSGKPIGADETARAYKVRIYPTVYVIGKDSQILTVKWPTTENTPEEVMAEVEKTIRDHLASAD